MKKKNEEKKIVLEATFVLKTSVFFIVLTCDKMANRNPIRQWFITFPQCNGKESRESFSGKFPPSDYSITAEEAHEEGGTHLHMGIRLIKGLSQAKLHKWIEAKWPEDYKRIHFKPVKGWENTIAYCNKEDPYTRTRGDFVVKKHMTLEEALRNDEEKRASRKALEKHKYYMTLMRLDLKSGYCPSYQRYKTKWSREFHRDIMDFPTAPEKRTWLKRNPLIRGEEWKR